jgi:hypothetical protein
MVPAKLLPCILAALLFFPNAFAQQKNNWNYDPENPGEVEGKGYYGIATKKFSVPHPGRDRELIIEKDDACPFLGFSGEMAWFKLGDQKFQAPKEKFVYKLKNDGLKLKYDLFINKLHKFLSDADRRNMLLFLREKNVISSIRDAEKTWSDERIHETYLKVREVKLIVE